MGNDKNLIENLLKEGNVFQRITKIKEDTD